MTRRGESRVRRGGSRTCTVFLRTTKRQRVQTRGPVQPRTFLMKRFIAFVLTAGISAAPFAWVAPHTSAADAPPAASAPTAASAQQDPAAQAQAMIDKGLAYL